MFAFLIAILLTQRLLELLLAARNRRWLLDNGGVEASRGHYRWLIIQHALFYPSLVLEATLLSPGWNPLWPLWVIVLVAAQALRVWAIVSLGRFWNTRVIVLPGSKPIAKGPYRWIRHPNYLVVFVEISTVPVLCGAYWTALFFPIWNACLLWRRIREEERALSELDSTSWCRLPRFVPTVKRSGT